MEEDTSLDQKPAAERDGASQLSSLAKANVTTSPTSNADCSPPNAAAQPPPPPPTKGLYQPLQKVYARDDDGLLYLSVVRRALFGPRNLTQCKLGYITYEEADELASMEDQTGIRHQSSWHYFIHFDGWNVKWDRWVAEANMYPQDNPVIQQYASRLTQEHKALRQSMMKANSGAKRRKKASIDSIKFLQSWRAIVDSVDEEFQIPNPQLDFFRGVTRDRVPTSLEEIKATHKKRPGKQKTAEGASKRRSTSINGKSDTNAAPEEPKRPRKRQRTAIYTVEQEQELRTKGLTRPRHSALAQQIVLPQSLKKIMVDQWEIICQCGMVATVPAPITVRQALDRYIQSKGVTVAAKKGMGDSASDVDCKPAASPLGKASKSEDLKPEAVAKAASSAAVDITADEIRKPSPEKAAAAITAETEQEVKKIATTVLNGGECDCKPTGGAKGGGLGESKGDASEICTPKSKEASSTIVDEEKADQSTRFSEFVLSPVDDPAKFLTASPADDPSRFLTASPAGDPLLLSAFAGDSSLEKGAEKQAGATSSAAASEKTLAVADAEEIVPKVAAEDALMNGLRSEAPNKHRTASANLPRTPQTQNKDTQSDGDEQEIADEAQDPQQLEEWIEMADGIALFFDEAIENLLYREEGAQFRVLQRRFQTYEDDHKAFSQLYGTEHLLRLFVRLPEVLAEANVPEARTILAKVNDLVRFLHKEQSNLFGLRHERPSPEILAEAAAGKDDKQKASSK